MALDFSLLFPSLLSSFLSCLKPSYIFVVVNVLIIIIIALSRCDLEYVNFDFMVTNPSPVGEVEMSKVVYEEKDEEILRDGGEEHMLLKVSENLSSSDTPLVSAGSGDRNMVKMTPKGKDKKASRVVEAKEGTSTHYQGPVTVVLGPGNDVKLALRKSETSRADVTNNLTPLVGMKKRMSHQEQDLEFDAFIKKTKKWMRQEQDLEFDKFIKKTKARMRQEQDLEFDAFIKMTKNQMRHEEGKGLGIRVK